MRTRDLPRSAGVCVLVLVACAREAPPAATRPAAALAGDTTAPPAGGASPVGASASPCAGRHVDLAAAVTDARCVFYEEDRATALRAAYEELVAKAPPDVRARVVGDLTVEIELTNTSPETLVVPLFLSQVVDLYTVTARRGRTTAHVSAEQAPAQGTARWDRGRNFAAISIPPGGSAFARLTLDPTIEESEYDCPPEAKCAPTKTLHGPLPAGTWQLEIGLPVYGTPLTAKVEWTRR